MSVEIKFLSFLLSWYAIMDPKTFTLSLKKKKYQKQYVHLFSHAIDHLLPNDQLIMKYVLVLKLKFIFHFPYI